MSLNSCCVVAKGRTQIAGRETLKTLKARNARELCDIRLRCDDFICLIRQEFYSASKHKLYL